jgi:hypothetical protein
MLLGLAFSWAYFIRLPKLFPRLSLRLTLLLLLLACTACADLLHGGIEFGSQRTQDCVPGSVSRPCN